MTSYARIELQKIDDIQRQLFAEEFNKKKRTLFHSYASMCRFYKKEQIFLYLW